MPSNIITQAAEKTFTFSQSNSLQRRGRRLEEERQTLNAGFESLNLRMKKFLPVEKQAKEACKDEIESIKKKLENNKKKKILLDCDLQALEVKEQGFTALDWRTFLSWKNHEDLPALVPFSTENSDFSLFVRQEYTKHQGWHPIIDTLLGRMAGNDRKLGASSRFFYQELHAMYEKAFGDVLSIEQTRGNDSVFKLTAAFSGVIPDDVKDLIKEERLKKRWDEILIIAEVESWEEEVIDPDPLVVGRSGTYLFHLAQFDLSATETAAMWEVDPRI